MVEITLTLILVFGFPLLFPTIWRGIEWTWWRFFSLGVSPAAHILQDYALKDFQLSIHERKIDKGLQDPIAASFALGARIQEFPYLHYNLRAMKYEMEGRMSDHTIKDLNEAWRAGLPWKVIENYLKTVEKISQSVEDEKRIYVLSTVANLRYLSGDLKQAHKLAQKNWKQVGNDLVLQWVASYAYFNTRALFLGQFEEVMEDLAKWWDEHCRCTPSDRRKIEEEIDNLLSKKLLAVNPISSIPRHMILIAALNEAPVATAFEGLPSSRKQYWPSEARDTSDELKNDYAQLDLRQLEGERKWVECWYKEAKKVSTNLATDDYISLGFSHAYLAFYFTLMCLDKRCDQEMLQDLCKEADKALEAVNHRITNVPVIQYVEMGCRGIRELVCRSHNPRENRENLEKALGYFRLAAGYSEISANRLPIFDLLVTCCHCVAAARIQEVGKRYVAPEVDYYLKQAKKIAERIGSRFYLDVYEAAYSEINNLRGNRGLVERIDTRLRMSQVKERIIRIFREDFQKNNT